MIKLEKRTYQVTTLIWFVSCVAHAIWLRHVTMTTLHDDTWYACSWSFEAIAFLFFFLPVWLTALGLLLGAEAFYFSWWNYNKSKDE